VNIGGVVVELATLHNEGDIRRKDIRVGDKVIVRRAGDVIPQVVKPIVEERTGEEQPYTLPSHCPVCGTELLRAEGEAVARCPNSGCPARRHRWIEHFAGESAMDIRGLGEKQVHHLLEHNLITTPADVYYLSLDALLSLPGIQEKSAGNLLRGIQRSKRQPLPRVILGLGIRYVGERTAELLAEAFGDLDAIMVASVEQLEGVEGIGRKTAESVAAWMEDSENRAFLERLRSAGVTWKERRQTEDAGPLTGLTFLLTGRLDTLSRTEAETGLRALGARIAPGMSKAVTYLIVGEDPGSKLDKAQKLGTPIKDEAWLRQVLETGSIPL
jgi:DNA ligase (NAD+)